MTSEIGNAWYNAEGPDNDVVISTRVRLARNLVNFPFPSRFTHDDGLRVQTLVFDAFSKITQAEEYESFSVKKLEPLGQQILLERGVLSSDYIESPVSGIVMKSDGKISCKVNVDDHMHIVSFCSGFDTRYAYSLARDVDIGLQDILQVAASIDFGYLTCKLENSGTGIKLSVFAHLPSLAQLNGEDNDLTALLRGVEEQGFSVLPVFGLSLQHNAMFSSAVGNCYQISTTLCLNGSEEDQILAFSNMVKSLIQTERLVREKISSKHPTILRDSVYKALAAVKYSRLLTDNEGLDLLFRLKWGRDSEILSGIDDYQLSSLLYRIREGHISFINRTGNFKFEKDINTSELQVQRLRALIMQESVENIQIFS